MLASIMLQYMSFLGQTSTIIITVTLQPPSDIGYLLNFILPNTNIAQLLRSPHDLSRSSSVSLASYRDSRSILLPGADFSI